MRVAFLNSFENEDRTKVLKLNPTKRRRMVNVLLLQKPKVNMAFMFDTCKARHLPLAGQYSVLVPLALNMDKCVSL